MIELGRCILPGDGFDPNFDGRLGLDGCRRLERFHRQDVIANRLDPWHGAWFHPYSFARLEVLSSPPSTGDVADDADRFLVAVTFRMRRLGVPVIAEFTSPEPRTIVMRIVDGEGTGSVVETHATPVGPGPGMGMFMLPASMVGAFVEMGACETMRAARPSKRPPCVAPWREGAAGSTAKSASRTLCAEGRASGTLSIMRWIRSSSAPGTSSSG